jgi:large subunit ribosomal protein L6
MSRIGKLPVAIPAGVEVKQEGQTLTVKGSKGELTQTFHKDMNIEVKDAEVVVTRPSDKKEHRALHGLTRSLINNMVTGVTNGYEKVLEIDGIGYKASKKGKVLELHLGYSHPIHMEDPDGIETSVDGKQISVKGIDKQKVGAHAAVIRDKRRPEPYKGRGVKYVDEYIRRKEGKTGA